MFAATIDNGLREANITASWYGYDEGELSAKVKVGMLSDPNCPGHCCPDLFSCNNLPLSPLVFI